MDTITTNGHIMQEHDNVIAPGTYSDRNEFRLMPYTLYEDPAITNPAELATFPKQRIGDFGHHAEHERHHVTQRTPVRDGRNITITDNHPGKNGFV
jgi:hypothetical protein